MKRRNPDRNREVSGILYLAVALFLGFAFYLPSDLTGWIGKTSTGFFRGLAGVASYAVPVFFLYLSIESFRERVDAVRRQRFAYTLVSMLCLAALFHIFTVDQTTFRSLFDQVEKPAWQAVKALWVIGTDPTHYPALGQPLTGGLAGGLAATALHAIGGRIGAPLLLIALLLIQIILIFDVSIRRAAGSARTAFHDTHTKVNDALRERVRVIRERNARAAEAKAGREDGTDVIEAQFDHLVQEDATDETSREPDSREETDIEVTYGGWLAAPHAHAHADSGHAAQDADIPQGEPVEPEAPPVPLPAGIVRVGLPAGHADRSSDDSTAGKQSESGDDKTTGKQGEGKAAGAKKARPRPYQSPPPTLLRPARAANNVANAITVNSLGRKLEETLASFGIAAKVSNITSGPSITRFELIPGPGIKVSRIVSLSDDIALSLAAVGVRIEAPIPGKSAIGVEIPNKETAMVALRGLIEAKEFQQFPSRLCAVLGRDIAGQPILCDLTRMPHLLIAGATGSGKSVCINALLMSVLFRAHPNEVKLILIDPKVVELTMYNGIPHLLVPVVTDPKKASNALIWAVNEMNNRYRKFSERSVRDVSSYNTAVEADGEEKMPLILIVIDELADLMASSPTEVEDSIARLTAMARAAGIHLVIATQRPSVDVITGVIKANIPSRIAFAVASQVDSRTILDMGGAEKLLGKGDMLYFPQSSPKPIRGQGAMVTDAEVETVIAFLKAQNTGEYDSNTAEAIIATPMAGIGRETQDADELLPAAVDVVIEAGYASVSLLQRRMNVGYPRAARLVDRMQEAGYVGPFEGSKPRKVIISRQRWMEIQSGKEEDS